MARNRSLRRRRRLATPGSKPGILHVDAEARSTQIDVMAYDESELVERELIDPADIRALASSHRVTWVNVTGLRDKATLEQLGKLLSIHPLALEDVVNVPQRPKAEGFDDDLFVVCQTLTGQDVLCREQVSLFVGKSILVTFQERPGDPFRQVRERLRNRRGRLRSSGTDYLMYALLDALIDQFFPALEALQDSLELLEIRLREPHPEALQEIQQARTQLREARLAVAPLRDVLRSLMAGEWSLLSDQTLLFMRDCRDHALEAYDQLESCREIASGLMDVHLGTVSHEANKTMKVLTIIATVFMPLSFLAGIYGMNFDPTASAWNMPELAAPYGYATLLSVMALVAALLLFWFWRKGWFK